MLAFAPEVQGPCASAVRAFRARHRGRPLVTMHARAGDYVRLGHAPDPDYYTSSLERVLRRRGGASACALVVSNSASWVREHLLPPLRAPESLGEHSETMQKLMFAPRTVSAEPPPAPTGLAFEPCVKNAVLMTRLP